jgi:hypothetical protein
MCQNRPISGISKTREDYDSFKHYSLVKESYDEGQSPNYRHVTKCRLGQIS